MWAAKSTAISVAKIVIYFLKFCYMILESASMHSKGTQNHRACIFKEMISDECQEIYALVLVWCARVSSVNMSCIKKAIKWPSSLPDIAFCSSHCVTIVLDIRCQWVDRKRENLRQSFFFCKNWSTFFKEKFLIFQGRSFVLCGEMLSEGAGASGTVDCCLMFVCDEAHVTSTLLRTRISIYINWDFFCWCTPFF